MRCVLCGLNFDRSSRRLPSGLYLQVATPCAHSRQTVEMRAPSLGGACSTAEHALDWRGQGAQMAERRNKTIAIVAARLVDHANHHQTLRNHISAVHLSAHTRVDKGFRTYVQSPENGPQWDHMVRRVAMNLDDNTIMQDIK
eukprot:7646237-Pyramimonas_sp.AAC.1